MGTFLGKRWVTKPQLFVLTIWTTHPIWMINMVWFYMWLIQESTVKGISSEVMWLAHVFVVLKARIQLSINGHFFRKKAGNKTTVICAWYSDNTSHLDDQHLLIGCCKLGQWCIACLVGMMSPLLSHNRTTDGVEIRSWLMILFSFQRCLFSLGI